MGGDGLGGLAMAIFIVMLAMVAGGFAILFLIGRAIGRRMGLSRGRRVALGIVSGVGGILLGLLAVAATFFESSWAPPPALTVVIPPGFEHRWVILLEDPRAPTRVEWRGAELPFQGRSATLAVPPSGIMRVQSLVTMAGRGDLQVSWSDGSSATGVGGGPVPLGLGATNYVALLRGEPVPGDAEEPPWHDQTKMAEYFKQREAGRPGSLTPRESR